MATTAAVERKRGNQARRCGRRWDARRTGFETIFKSIIQNMNSLDETG